MDRGATNGQGRRADAYAGLAAVETFARLADPALYAALPDDWVLGLADVVRSTEAIAVGRYKAVNTAGAAVIAAVSNALGQESFPFVFGGDGAGLALPPRHEATLRAALAATAAWADGELGFRLRAAVVPVSAARAAGHDVRVARFAPSPNVAYAMFAGGGLAWAEARMKEGLFAVAPAEDGARPNLAGLSCRFAEIPAERGLILSLIVMPGPAGDAPFQAVVEEVLALVEAEVGRAVPDRPPALIWPPPGLELEARARRPAGGSLFRARLAAGARTLVSHLVFRFGLPLKGFDPARYRRELVENTDFRKFDDGLRMTVDCPPALADRLEARLAAAEAEGAVLWGTHRQDAAVMTCFVPSASRHDHVHFVDGAAGGYALAAQALKRRAGAAAAP